MRTAAILPVKRFVEAKQRLGQSLSPDRRRELAAAMAADVLSALMATPTLDLVIVVTNEDSVREAAIGAGAIVIGDVHEQGQSPAAAAGIRCAEATGAERVLLVPGDCPSLRPEELEELLRDGTPGVVIVPDRHGSGTNALMLAPPTAITPSFGPQSRARHESLAAAAGVPWRLAHPASLLLDVDTGSDLTALRERLAAAVDHEDAPGTRAWLQSHAAVGTDVQGDGSVTP